jgi:hypothetical protein
MQPRGGHPATPNRAESGCRNGTRRFRRGPASYVAVGDVGTIVTSDGGEIWTPRRSGTGWQLRAVTHSNDRFVAVGDHGTLLVSGNGIDWTVLPSPVAVTLRGVRYHAGQFTAVGDGGTIITSTDGLAWREVPSCTNNALRAIASGAGDSLNSLVAVGAGSTVLLHHAPNN